MLPVKGLFCESLSDVVVGCGSGVLKWSDLWSGLF